MIFFNVKFYLFFPLMAFWKWSGQNRVSSDFYCYHYDVLWKYVLKLNVLLCHVYNNTSGFKIVKTLIWTMFVAAIIGPDRQLS